MTLFVQKPGQYFLRPMMKEFDFEPSSRIVDVVEGSQITVSVAAKRIAFRYGRVLNTTFLVDVVSSYYNGSIISIVCVAFFYIVV